jgi:hypothetical protein
MGTITLIKNYSFPVECGKTYYVRHKKPNTLPKKKKTIDKENGKTNLDIALEKEQCKVAVGDDLGIASV